MRNPPDAGPTLTTHQLCRAASMVQSLFTIFSRTVLTQVENYLNRAVRIVPI
ncbi:hypothetical protein J2X44_001291 [Sphingopyxis sp. BE259]|nr:hypothetical protein [Sphingopyxis sp. BE122]MDR7226755.1 hypothetical protein [Sphingopyxis sp. BE259]